MKPNDDKWGWQERLIAVALFVTILFLLWQVAIRTTAAAEWPPRSITVRAPLQNVVCANGLCCGSAEVRYRGDYYLGQYCRWFRTLRDGQVVRLTVYR